MFTSLHAGELLNTLYWSHRRLLNQFLEYKFDNLVSIHFNVLDLCLCAPHRIASGPGCHHAVTS